MEKYYLGLDIGTNSVGWAVTDENYKILRRKGKATWGIRLFDEAQTAADRRVKRANRRRLARRNERIALLQELFAEEMYKVDETFFMRLKESHLYQEDKTTGLKYPLFADKDYTDIDYHKDYPTIFHLRKELLESTAPHDIRLVYLALAHILKNRGHFLIEGGLGNATAFEPTFNGLKQELEDILQLDLVVENMSAVEEIYRDKQRANSDKHKALKKLIQVNANDLNEDPKQNSKMLDAILKLSLGMKGDIKTLFENLPDTLEKTSFSFADGKYEEEIKPQLEAAMPDECIVVDRIKTLYDWNILSGILGGERYLSIAKVHQYEAHKKNLKHLKHLMKAYSSAKEYRTFFNAADDKGYNYSNHIGSLKTKGKQIDVKKCSEEDFYKNLKKILSSMKVKPNDQALYDEVVKLVDQNTLLPLQRSKDNGAVPHQVHEVELKQILLNAEQYLPFLKEADQDGISTSEKIRSLLTFRVPYYVGPLSTQHAAQGANAWMVRREEGRIYPWNFEQKVDLAASNDCFIRRMTNKCTYLIGEDVLPKNSLLYSRFMVLNELNNLKIRGKKITVPEKQDIFNNVFANRSRVTGKALLTYLRQSDPELKAEDLSGFDQDFKAALTSYLDFNKQVFKGEMANDENRKIAEDVIRWKTIYGDDNKMLERVAKSVYPSLTEDQLKGMRKLHYSGWGNFSEKFLSGVEGVHRETGEIFTIIQALWQTNANLMQLLSSDYTFKEEIDSINQEHAGKITSISYDSLVKDLYVSPANKRAIWQCVQIAEEVRKIMGGPADRIFVEMARGSKEKEKKPTKSRKQQLLDLYAACKDDTRNWTEEISERDEREFNSIKLYLYYTQMGRCMYTGAPIDLHELMQANSKWDRDHIYPQSRIKDDSLDNLVLVNKTVNSKKSNELLSAEVREKMQPTWRMLQSKGLITKTKYDRLTRTEDFTPEELAGFINRQLVETRQSSKAVAELLGRLYGAEGTKIVYVKAALASQFRKKELGMLKSRRINDYHHAKDAYLNIVVGNVYNAKFTSNPVQWIRKNKDTNYSLNRVFEYDVKRGNQLVWEKGARAEKKGATLYGGTIDLVRKTMKRNDILYTEYSYCSKGELFNATIEKKDGTGRIPTKKGLPVEKYGGYKSANTAYFALISFAGKKGERVRNVMEVPIYIANQLSHDPQAYVKYLTEEKGLKDVEILYPCIKRNALIEMNGYPMRIRGCNDRDLMFKNGIQPRLGAHESTVHYIEKVVEKLKLNKAFKVNSIFDSLNDGQLLSLYDDCVLKLEDIYTQRPANQVSLLKEHREQFISLSLTEKVITINEILTMLCCAANTTADLSKIGGSSMMGSMKVNKNTFGKSKLVLINQSVTGLYETRVEL